MYVQMCKSQSVYKSDGELQIIAVQLQLGGKCP
jgi:hypothetical protein